MQGLFKQFSFPGGVPSHVAPETRGSIHEGGELGYSLSHAFGAVFDNSDLIAACVVGAALMAASTVVVAINARLLRLKKDQGAEKREEKVSTKTEYRKTPDQKPVPPVTTLT